ncbi:MAG: NAD(P)/FAD-dependent oxidoreductase [Bacilli bacterium]|nr:NAD(P)/FAD-dependent oxidoreductase [Bacilli bacterium]
MNDVIVIGAGPAGVSISLYLKRSNKKVLVFDSKESNLFKAHQIENYYGIKSISGKDLYQEGINQLNNLEIPIKFEEVVKLEKEENFKIYTNNGEYESKAVVIATGLKRGNSNLNAKEYEGKGLSYCATCDGFFYKNKKLAVVGNSSLAYDEIKYLKNITNNIVLLTNNKEQKENFNELNIEIVTDEIKNIIGAEKVQGIMLKNEEVVQVDGIFIAESLSATVFNRTLGLEMNKNYIKVDDTYQTNITGLYAIGDIIGEPLQIGKAVSDGIKASSFISKFLKEK